MNLNTYMIRNDHSAIIAKGDVDGTPLTLRAKTRKGWSGTVDIYLSVRGEKPVKVTTVDDNIPCGHMQDYLEAAIDLDYIAWVDGPFSLEPHVSSL